MNDSRRIRSYALLLIASLICFSAAQPAPLVVVASTSWTAAMARAAGLENVTELASADMQHPPEYALKPSDVVTVADADVVIYAGYESFVERLLQATGGDDVVRVQVTTVNAPVVLVAEVRKIAEAAGTRAAFDAWHERFAGEFEQLAESLRELPVGERVLVHALQQAQVEALGMTVVGTFGPAPVTPNQIVQLRDTAPTVIIDNYHNPVGRSLAENLDARYLEFINFPGTGGTASLIDVIRFNVELLLADD